VGREACLADVPGGSRGPSVLVEVQPMEFGDDARVQDVASPGLLLWIVSLPINQVLSARSLTAGVQQVLNGVGGTTINEAGE